jgi:hypothetical protein
MKHKAGIYLFAAVLAVSGLTYGCGGSGEVVAGEKLEWSKIEDLTMAGKTITIEGFPELPFIMMTGEGTSTVNLSQRMNQYSGKLVVLTVKEGNDENTIKVLPDDYQQSDLELHDNKGEKIVYGDKIRITGKASVKNNQYHVEVEFIEKVDAAFDYKANSVRLTDSSDAEKLNKQLVWVEGEMYVADEQGGMRLEMYLDDTTLSDYILCKIEYGSLKNQADEMPETYTEDDVVFRDHTGKKMGEGTRVRVYGTWSPDDQLIGVEHMEWVSDPVEEDME